MFFIIFYAKGRKTSHQSLIQRRTNLDPVTHVVQHAVVDGLTDVTHGPLRIGRGDDFVRAGRVLVGGEDADLPPGDLLFVDVHRLETADRMLAAEQATSAKTGEIG